MNLASNPATVAEVATKPSIAVLPFKNLSADADGAYFADAIQEEILGVEHPKTRDTGERLRAVLGSLDYRR